MAEAGQQGGQQERSGDAGETAGHDGEFGRHEARHRAGLQVAEPRAAFDHGDLHG